MSTDETMPWEADHELPLRSVRAAVEEAVPELAPATVRLLGRGWAFDAWLVNEAWVFRFPRRARYEGEPCLRHTDLHPEHVL